MMSGWRHFFHFACLTALLSLVGPLNAKTILVRAGEHPGFTRLVFDVVAKTPWRLGRNSSGYEFQLLVPDAEFDISAIFDRIPRDRLVGVSLAKTPGALSLVVSGDNHAMASETPAGQIVLDIVTGKPKADSPFESNIADVVATESDAAPLLGDAAKTSIATGAAATLTFRPTQNQDASLPLYWRQGPDAPSAPPVKVDDGLVKPPPTKPERLDPSQTATTDGTPTLFTAPPILPVVLPKVAHGDPASGVHGPADATHPSPGVAIAETELLRQLSRAASQGLIALNPPDQIADPLKPSASPRPNAPAAQGMNPESGQKTYAGHIEFHAETSIDRDAPENPMGQDLTAQGDACLQNETINFANWGDARPASEQLTEARSHLLGEFDRPDAAAVGKLARLYLFFGMGAEARQTLTAFAVTPDDAQIISDLGLIVDDRPVAANSPLHAMRDCEGAVAIWAFLAAPDAAAVKHSDQNAIVRAFSGLPGQIRYALAQRASDRLIEIGEADAAKSVRNAVARTREKEDRVVGLIDARLDLNRGMANTAEAKLDHLANGNDTLSTDATVMALQSRLARGEVIDSKQIETVTALAFEHHDSPDSAEFSHLAIMAQASGGDFARAFDSYVRWKADDLKTDDGQTARQLFGMLASKATDQEFLKTYFASQALIADAGGDIDMRQKLAGRLAELGFGEEVRHVLEGEAARTEVGRMQLARAALSLFDPETALRELEGSSADSAIALRAEADTMLGDHRGAAAALKQIGATEAAAAAAWRGGDWSQAAQGPETLRKAAAGMILAAMPKPNPVDAPASLQGAKTVLQDSAALRQTLQDLIGTTNVAAAKSP